MKTIFKSFKFRIYPNKEQEVLLAKHFGACRFVFNHYLKCHLIFVCKYRKKLLVGQLKDDMKQLLLNIASKSDFEIEVMESDIDHIHFLIRYIPRLSITSIVRKLKQESTYHIWRSVHRNYLHTQFWVEKTFWSDGYFVCSIGEANPNTIKQYILTQG
jgi:putative transposase